jgi:hypothetical protein
MMANAAFLATLTTFVLVGWLASELVYLVPYKTLLFRQHGSLLAICLGAVFLNLCAAYYTVARWLLLRDTGRKLSHLDRQLGTSDAVLDDLHRDLTA